jgi:ribonuclease J
MNINLFAEGQLSGNINIQFNPPISSHKKTITSWRTREIPLKIVPLGWLEQVGENMMFLEYRSDIIIIDAWMLMPGGEVYWVDYIIPDISYLKKKVDKIKAIFITHGHLDHIWALKHILPELNYPIVYSTNLTIALIKKQLEWTPHLKKFKYQVIDPDKDIVKAGVFTVEFFRVNHSIPEAVWLAIHTPKWLIVHTWDFKIDYTPALDKVADLAKIARIWQEWVKILFSDSTNATKPWRTPSEQQIGETLEQIIKESKSRLIIATFSSLIWRISQIIKYAEKYWKIVFLSWRSMINNVEIAKQLWYINPAPWIVRRIWPDAEAMPDHKVIILTTWSQGEEFSALVRIAKWEHPHIKIRPGDRVLLSAVPIPGNELAVVNMINELIRKWADVITNQELDLHVSWHWRQDDLKLMLSLVKPQYFVPVHWELYMRYAHKKLATQLWIPEENVFLIDNWNILEVYNDEVKVSDKKLKLDTIMIDWLGIWHLSWEYVIKARKIMAEDGMIALIFKVDSNTKQLIWNIQIESRWFVYSSEVRKVHTNIVEFARKKYYEYLKQTKEVKEILKKVKEDLQKFILQTIWRQPMVVLMYVYIKRDSKWNVVDDMKKDDALVWMTLVEQGSKEEK